MYNNRVRQTVERLKPIDDDFFHKLSEDIGFCEEVLQVILQKPDLQVLKVMPQKSIRNIEDRSVIVDVLCKDSEGNYYNIEMQKKNDDDHQRRVRYNGSNVDTYVAEKGVKFSEIPDVYVVFISKFDYFGKKKTVYHVDRVLRETGDIVDNGFYEIYVNTEIDDGTDIAGLMKILKSSQVKNDERFPRVCKRIRYFKEGKGDKDMSDVVEEYAKEYAEEYVKEEIKKVVKELIAMDLDDISIHKATKLSFDEIQSIRRDLEGKH